MCLFNLVFFYLYYISECMCVSFSLFFFSFLISILYVYVRNALLKQKNKLKKKTLGLFCYQKSVSDSRYLSKLQDAVLESLRKMKGHGEAKNPLEADIWCHFGSAVIRGPNEGK